MRRRSECGNVRVAEDVLDRDFAAGAPNRCWVADITYLRTWQGWLYLVAVQDLYSRRIVGWAMADHMRTELVTDALQMARGASGQVAPSSSWISCSLRFRTCGDDGAGVSAPGRAGPAPPLRPTSSARCYVCSSSRPRSRRPKS